MTIYVTLQIQKNTFFQIKISSKIITNMFANEIGQSMQANLAWIPNVC